jgi:hypothetical protein
LTARQASPSEVVGWPGGRRCCADSGIPQRGGFRKLVVYCLRGCWWGGMGRAQSPRVPEGSGVAEGRRVVRPKSNVPKKPYGEGLSRLGFRRRCRCSLSVGALSGEKQWCASRAKDGGVTVATKMWTQQHKIERKAKQEQPKTEHRDAYTRVHKVNVLLEQTRAKSMVFWWT